MGATGNPRQDDRASRRERDQRNQLRSGGREGILGQCGCDEATERRCPGDGGFTLGFVYESRISIREVSFCSTGFQPVPQLAQQARVENPCYNMRIDRRQFLKSTLAAGAAAALPNLSFADATT